MLYPVPDARMITQAGKPFDLATARGNVTVYDFIFTNCAASCPMMTRTMGALVKRTDRSQPVRFISISVDPLRDSPAVLASYASRSGADERWSFLTGDPATVRSVTVNGFKLAVEPVQAGSEALLHSTKFVLADRRGMIRGYYDSNFSDEMKKLDRDIATLVDGR